MKEERAYKKITVCSKIILRTEKKRKQFYKRRNSNGKTE
jgi:hypothetical protein